MRHEYRLKQNTLHSQEGKEYIAYGIEAVDPSGTVLKSFADVFFDRKAAEDFVALCNRCELSLLHFADAVEDAIGGQYVVLSSQAYEM